MRRTARSLFDRGGHWYYECQVRFVYNGSEEEILEFKDLWKVLMLETSRDENAYFPSIIRIPIFSSTCAEAVFSAMHCTNIGSGGEGNGVVK